MASVAKRSSALARTVYIGLAVLVLVPVVVVTMLVRLAGQAQHQFAETTQQALDAGKLCAGDPRCLVTVAHKFGVKLWLINTSENRTEVTSEPNDSDASDLGLPSIGARPQWVKQHERSRPIPAQREPVIVAAQRGSAASCASADDDRVLRCESAVRLDAAHVLLAERIAPRSAARLQYAVWPLLTIGGVLIVCAVLLAWLWVRRIARSLDEAVRETAGVKQQQIDRLSEMMHNLKGPLQRVRLAIDSPMPERLAGADDAVDQIDSTVNSLLSLSRLDVGLPPSAFTTVNLQDFIDSCVDHESFESEGQINIVISNVDSRLVHMDVSSLGAAVAQLVDNAKKFAKHSVRISAGLASDAGKARGSVAIVVEDDGPGVDAEIIDKIFDRFVSRRPGGTGLGLAMVQAVAVAHGGSASVSSSALGGAKFTMVIAA
jgi:signal transduction histidine kinase